MSSICAENFSKNCGFAKQGLRLVQTNRSILSSLGCWACLLLPTFIAFGAADADEPSASESQAVMLATLEAMAREEPAHADTWRLIGRIHRQQRHFADAESAFRRALFLQPNNVAAHYDIGELYEATNRSDAAREHFERVIQLAPESGYAQQLVSRNAVATPVVEPVFPSVERVSALVETPTQSPAENIGEQGIGEELLGRTAALNSNEKDVQLFIETGTLYSTNIGLAPISRELTASDGSGFQAFLSPDVQWTMTRSGNARAGALFRGFFTLNEGQFRSLDIGAFQPGAFVERDVPSWGVSDATLRLEYSYALNLFGGTRFGDRHAVTASFTAMPTETDAVFGYLSFNVADFTNDGADPAIDSLDGPAFIVGLSRIRQTTWKSIPWTSFGAEFQHVDTEGEDFRFNSITFHGSTTFQLLERLQFITNTGIGYRHYGDFTSSYSRDELTLRAGAQLKWQFSEDYSVATVIDYNRFASMVEVYDTERTEAGVVFTIQR